MAIPTLDYLYYIGVKLNCIILKMMYEKIKENKISV